MPSYEIRLPSSARRPRHTQFVAVWALVAAVLAAWLCTPTSPAAPRRATAQAAAAALAALAEADGVVVQCGPMAEGTGTQAVVGPAPRALISALVGSGTVAADCGCPATARLCFTAGRRGPVRVEVVHGRALRWVGDGPRGLVELTRGSAEALCRQLGDLGLPVGGPQWDVR